MKDEQYSAVPAAVGSFKALIRSKDSKGKIETKELQSRTCTKAELGLDKDKLDQAKFFPPESLDTSNKLSKYASKMRCFDEPLDLRGNSEAAEFDQFVLQFTYCVDDANKAKNL